MRRYAPTSLCDCGDENRAHLYISLRDDGLGEFVLGPCEIRGCGCQIFKLAGKRRKQNTLKASKAWERQVAEDLEGQRLPSTGRGNQPDVVVAGAGGGGLGGAGGKENDPLSAG